MTSGKGHQRCQGPTDDVRNCSAPAYCPGKNFIGIRNFLRPARRRGKVLLRLPVFLFVNLFACKFVTLLVVNFTENGYTAIVV